MALIASRASSFQAHFDKSWGKGDLHCPCTIFPCAKEHGRVSSDGPGCSIEFKLILQTSSDIGNSSIKVTAQDDDLCPPLIFYCKNQIKKSLDGYNEDPPVDNPTGLTSTVRHVTYSGPETHSDGVQVTSPGGEEEEQSDAHEVGHALGIGGDGYDYIGGVPITKKDWKGTLMGEESTSVSEKEVCLILGTIAAGHCNEATCCPIPGSQPPPPGNVTPPGDTTPPGDSKKSPGKDTTPPGGGGTESTPAGSGGESPPTVSVTPAGDGGDSPPSSLTGDREETDMLYIACIGGRLPLLEADDDEDEECDCESCSCDSCE